MIISAPFFRNSVFVLVARLTELLAGILAVGWVTRYLGAERFGEYSFVWATATALAPLVALGCGRILIRDLAVDAARTGTLVASALLLNGALALLALGVMWGIVGIMLPSPLALLAATLAIAAQSLLVMQQTVSAVFIARERMIYDPLIVIVTRVLLLALLLAIMAAHLSYPFLFLANGVAGLIGLALASGILMRRFARPVWGVRRAELAYLAAQSAPVAGYNFLGQSFAFAGVLLLTQFQTLEQVSFFQAPQRVIAPLMILPMSLLFAFTPAIARLGADAGQGAALRAFYALALRLILVVVLPVCLLMSWLAPQLVRGLFGADFAGAARSFGILGWSIAGFALSALLNTILTSLKKQNGLIITHLAALGVNLAIGPWLVMRYGSAGASAAFLVSFTCLFLFNHYYLAAQIGSLPLWSAVWRPCLATLGAGGLWWLGADRVAPIALIIVAGLVYAGLALALRAVSVDDINQLVNRRAPGSACS
ncbi:MAG: polysaccharide biosynthesis C-terminal domain-containing protein [Kiritimatiellae bacterium]|nr:polysaccharide biosynthesis C-terminal domain-containing protein [Kiritimatiellia bacterium]